MTKIHFIGSALVAAAIVAGCNKNEENPADPANEAMLVVNGEKLTRGQIDADVATIFAAQGDKIPAEQAEYAKRSIANRIAQSFLYENVLCDKAKKLGYTLTDADVKAREEEFLKSVAGMPDAPKSLDEAIAKSPLGKERTLAEFRNSILIDKMIKAEVVDKNTKDYSAEAQQMIDGIVSNNAANASSEADALKKVQGLKAQLDATAADKIAEKFAELAAANSDCPSSAKGGDLDFFAQGAMVPEFEKAAFGLEVGKVSAPVKTPFGYHLIMVTAKKDAVEAKNEQPAEPAKVRASHILCKINANREVPALADVVKYMKSRDERENVNAFVISALREVKVEASEDYKNLLPPPEETAAPAEVPVETPVEK